MHKRRLFFLDTLRARSILAACALCCASAAASAQAAQAAQADGAARRATSVARVVLGILSYVRWPQTPSPVRLCVLGPTEYADDLLAGAPGIAGRHIHAQRLLPDDETIGTACDAVYTGVMTDVQRRVLYEHLANLPIVSIDEQNVSCTVGAMFCLNVAPNHVSFKVNLDSVARSSVRVHPNVLQLGRGTSTPQGAP